MNGKWINMALAVLFLIVGIMATANTIRFNKYVKETLPRDVAQEQCNTATINVLKSWIEARSARDGAMDMRDDAAVTALEGFLANGSARPEDIVAWRDAVANDRKVRATAGEKRLDLPLCYEEPK